MRFRCCSFALLILSAWTTAPAAAVSCPRPDSLTHGLHGPLADVRYLADDALEGRRAGTPGARCAGDYIAARFRNIGLRPGGEDDSYFQRLPLTSAINPHAPGGTGRNVIGILDGSDPLLQREYVVVGAHYDHLGHGGFGSLAPDQPGAIHNGADDNASGVADLLRVAELLSAGPRPARSVLFIAFTGEESGLLGSAYFAAHPTVPGTALHAMLNMDMVGRLGTGALIINGVDTATEWRSIIESAGRQPGLTFAYHGEGYGPSDHTSFYAKGIPVLHFFTNVHADYHRPTDDWQKIDAAGLETVAHVVAGIARATADRREALTLNRNAGKPPAGPGSDRGYGAYLGSVPDFAGVQRGVRLSGVSPGSPAEKAGIRAGDIIVRLGEHDVPDLQGLTDALRAHVAGDSVAVVLLRGGERTVVRVVLGSRTSR